MLPAHELRAVVLILLALVGALYAPYLVQVACAEAFAVALEAGWLRSFGLRHSRVWSLFANGLSLGLGLLCREHFGFP